MRPSPEPPGPPILHRESCLAREPRASSARAAAVGSRFVGIAYRSEFGAKSQVGHARVECVAGCTCTPLLINARVTRNSDAHIRMAEFNVELPRSSLLCSLRIRTMSGNSSRADIQAPVNFRIMALFVNPYSARRFFGEWLMRRALSSLAQGHAADLATFGSEHVLTWDT